MVNPEYIGKLMEVFRHMHGAPPIETEGGQRHILAITSIFAEAATNEAHADRMVNHLLANCSFFPKAPEIHAAADATRAKPQERPIDTSWEPITEAELNSPEFLQAAKILRCEPEQIFGPAGDKPAPMAGLADIVTDPKTTRRSTERIAALAEQSRREAEMEPYRDWMRKAEGTTD